MGRGLVVPGRRVGSLRRTRAPTIAPLTGRWALGATGQPCNLTTAHRARVSPQVHGYFPTLAVHYTHCPGPVTSDSISGHSEKNMFYVQGLSFRP